MIQNFFIWLLGEDLATILLILVIAAAVIKWPIIPALKYMDDEMNKLRKL